MSCSSFLTSIGCYQYMKCGCQWFNDTCSGLLDIKCIENSNNLQYADIEYTILFVAILILLFIVVLMLFITRIIIRRSLRNNDENDDVLDSAEIVYNMPY